MRGLVSGRGRAARQVDEFLKLDMADIDQVGFTLGHEGCFNWRAGSKIVASVSFKMALNRIYLKYTVRGVPKQQNVLCLFTDQKLGGSRRWFECPSCSRRCRILYGLESFLCRQCCSATYPSQYAGTYLSELAAADRALRKIDRFARSNGIFPEKPKGMHWRTYRSLEAAFYDSELVFELGLIA